MLSGRNDQGHLAIAAYSRGTITSGLFLLHARNKKRQLRSATQQMSFRCISFYIFASSFGENSFSNLFADVIDFCCNILSRRCTQLSSFVVVYVGHVNGMDIFVTNKCVTHGPFLTC